MRVAALAENVNNEEIVLPALQNLRDVVSATEAWVDGVTPLDRLRVVSP
jgi:hypothetical protein